MVAAAPDGEYTVGVTRHDCSAVLRARFALWISLRGTLASIESWRLILVALVAVMAGAPALASDSCPGDCDRDGRVSVAELIRGVQCYASPIPEPGRNCEACYTPPVGINKLIQGVNNALSGCPQPIEVPTATPTFAEEATVLTYVPYRQCGLPMPGGDFDPTPIVDQLRAEGWTIVDVLVTRAAEPCEVCGCPVPGSPIVEVTVIR